MVDSYLGVKVYPITGQINNLPRLIFQTEVWKDIPGYEGHFRISTLGRIKSLTRVVKWGRWRGRRTVYGKMLHHRVSANGYLRTVLTKDGVRNPQPVHRLVLLTFCGREEGRPDVNHKNLNKLDNRLFNLEWCTRGENIKHAVDSGRLKPKCGEASESSKVTESTVKTIKKLRLLGHTNKSISNKLGVSYHIVKAVNGGKSWRHVTL